MQTTNSMGREGCWRGFVVAALLAGAAQPVSAEVIRLRQDCGSEANCYESLNDVLADLHESGGYVEPPNSSNPVLVDIGASTFELTSLDYPYCEDLSHITFAGSGRETTILKTTVNSPDGFETAYGGASVFNPYVARIANCDDVEFRELSFEGDGSQSGVVFEGDGETYWANMEIEVSGSGNWAWVDVGASAVDASVHHWNHSRLAATSGAGAGIGSLYAIESTHRIVASTLETTATSGDIIYGALYADATGFDVSVQGSRIVARNTASTKNATAIFTGYASADCAAGSRLVITGSEIEAITNSGNYATGIYNNCDSDNPGDIQVQGSWFRLTGATNLRRLLGAAAGINSPYSLGAGANPPSSVKTVWSSAKGMDSFVETDCSSTKCAGTSQGSESHLLVFDAACTNTDSDHGPWWDTNLQECRGT